jgi:predicted nucleic acid-binding protein
VHEFFSIVTHERIYSPPTPPAKALEQIDAWLESPSVVPLAETEGYWDVLTQIISKSKVSGPRVHDGRIAALCIHHGVRELLSADRDFSRFGNLKTRNPLVVR